MPWNAQITDALKAGTLNGLLVNLDSGDDIQAQKAAKYIQLSPQLWMGHVYLLTINKARWGIRSTLRIKRLFNGRQHQPAPNWPTARCQPAQYDGLDAPKRRQHYLAITRRIANLAADQPLSTEQDKWVAEQEKQGVSNVRRILAQVTSLLDEAMH